MSSQDLDTALIDRCISEKNWGLLQNSCKSYIAASSTISKEEKSIEVITILLKKAISLAKEWKFKESILLRNMIDNLKLDANIKSYVKLAYDFINYLSCALREKGYIHKAKVLTEKAIKLSQKFSTLNKSACFMNMCAIFSSMGQHDKALLFAKKALEHIYNELELLKIQGNKKKIVKKCTKVAIANYNQAIEEEFLSNKKQAIQSYQTSLKVLTSNNIPANDLMRKIQDSIERLIKLEENKKTSPFINRSKSQTRNYGMNLTPVKSQKVTSPIKRPKSMKVEQEKVSIPQTSRYSPSNKGLRSKFSSKSLSKNPSDFIKTMRVMRKSIENQKDEVKNCLELDEIDIEDLKAQDKQENYFTEQDFVLNTQIRNKTEDLELKKPIGSGSGIKNPENAWEKITGIRVIRSRNLKMIDFDDKNAKKSADKYEHSPGILGKKPKKQSNDPGSKVVSETENRKYLADRLKTAENKRQSSLTKAKISTNPSLDLMQILIPQTSINEPEPSPIKEIKVQVLNDSPKLLKAQEIEAIKTNSETTELVNNKKNPQISKKSTKNDLAESTKSQKFSTKNENSHNFDNQLAKYQKNKLERPIKKAVKSEGVVKSKKTLKTFEAKDDESANKNIIEEGLIVLSKNTVKVQVNYQENRVHFMVSNICVFTMLAVYKIYSIPLILSLKYKHSGYRARKIKYIEEIFREKRLMSNGFEYYVMVFYIKEKRSWYYFHAVDEESPLITGIGYTEDDMIDMFKIQEIKSCISEIARKMIIMNGVLNIESTKKLEEELVLSLEDEKRIVKIQATLRGKRCRDMLKLQMCKNTLICSHIKMCHTGPHIVKLFKVDESILIEISKSQENTCFYGFLKTPTDFITNFFKYSHTILLVNAIRIDKVPYINTLEGNSLSFISSEYDVEEFSAIAKTFIRDDYGLTILCAQLLNRNIIVKIFNYKENFIVMKKYTVSNILEFIGKYDISLFISTISLENQTIINTKIPHKLSRQVLLEFQDQVLYRVCTKIESILYQVTVIKFNDQLKFCYNSSSLQSLGYEFTIDISLACEKSGFSDTLIIPMANYMIKHMLILKNKEILLDTTKKPIDIDLNIRKIQATFRSFLLRKKFNQMLFMKFLKKIKKPMDSTIYTVLLYEKPTCYALFAVNLSEVYVKYIKKTTELSPEFILKTNINDLFARRSVSPADAKHLIGNRGKTLASENDKNKKLKWQGKGVISETDAFVIVYRLDKHELVECHILEKVLCVEIDIGYLPHDLSIFNKLEFYKNIEVHLKIKQKHVVFFQVREITNYLCRVHIINKKGQFILIVFVMRLKRYFIKNLGEDVNLTKILDNAKIVKTYDSFVLGTC